MHDPQASPAEAQSLFGIDLLTSLDGLSGYDAVVGAVKHREYGDLNGAALESLLAGDGLLADIKGIWRGLKLRPEIRRWQL